MNDKIVVCIQKGGQRDQAESFARRTGSVIADKPGKELTVLFDSKGVSLTGYGLTYQGDFENMLHRVTNGRLQHEMLVRAAKSEKEGRRAIAVSYTHLRAHETDSYLVCRLLLEKKKNQK